MSKYLESDSWFNYFLMPQTLDEDLERLTRTQLGHLLCYFLSQGYQAYLTTQNHLLKERPPTLVAEGEPLNHEERCVITHKIDVMDILALKVASQMEFDLQFLQDSLPTVLQDRLLRKFLQLATGISKFDPFHDVGWPAWTAVGRWAHILFHRWCLKTYVDNEFASYRPSKPEPVNVPQPKGLTEIPAKAFEKGNSSVLHFIKTNRALCLERIEPYLIRNTFEVAMPRPKCFVYPKTDAPLDESVEQKWDFAVPMPAPSFQALVALDIGRYFFQDRRFNRAAAAFAVIPNVLGHLSPIAQNYVQPNKVQAYLQACRSFEAAPEVMPNRRQQLKAISDRLAKESRSRRGGMKQMSLNDELVRNTTSVLLSDTLDARTELSRFERTSFEAGLLPQFETLNFAVMTCNLLDRVVSGQALLSLYAERLAPKGEPGVAFLLSCLSRCFAAAKPNEQLNLKCFVWYLLQALPDELQMAPALLACEGCLCYFDQEEKTAIRRHANQLSASKEDSLDVEDLDTCEDLPPDPWFDEEEYEEEDEVESGPSGAAAVDAMRLLTSYDPEEIRILIDRLLDAPGASYSRASLVQLSEKWQVSPKEFGQLLCTSVHISVDFVYLYVLVAKAQLLKNQYEWEGARQLLLTAERVSNGEGTYRVCKLVRQELCLLSMASYLARGIVLSGPGGVAGPSGEAELVQACKTFLTAIRIDAEAVASEEFVLTAICLLLSTAQGAYLGELLNSGFPLGQGALLLAKLLGRLQEPLGPEDALRGHYRDLWDFLARCLPLAPAARRSGTQQNAPLSREAFLFLLSHLRDRRHLTLLLSGLIAMCRQQLADLNILIYSGSASLPDLWPSGCLNVNQEALQEAVTMLLDSALAKFPNECTWLLVRAELAFSQRHYKRALCAYLECGLAASDFFSQAIPEELYSRRTLQRMLKCCEEMRFYGQAIVLCQMATTDQGETDYKSAVRFLKMQEDALDSIDSYLPFMWDVTLLELAAAICGQRYGAVEKRARIIATICRPELNMANKPDIKHNGEAQRRLAFLRLMCEHHFV